MSQVWRCDFCEKETFSPGPTRPPGWASCQMKRLESGPQFTMAKFDACEKCKPVLTITLDKKNAIDMLKRLHVITEATLAGKKGDT